MESSPSSIGNPGPLSSDDSISPQVCDRCRIKKVGCDGVLPNCGNCIAANAECVISVRLRRKTKPRRYTEPKDHMIKKLRADNQILKSQLDAVGSNPVPVVSPPHEVPFPVSEYQDLQQRQPLPDVQWHLERPSTTPNHLSDPRNSSQPPSDPVIKHLGRLVSTDFGVDRFAGTTTGVHFIHSAEQKYQQLFNTAEVFPQCVFRLHMLPQPKSLWNLPSHQIHSFSQRFGFEKSRTHYSYRLDRFFRRWSTIYPTLSPRQVYEAFHRVMDFVERNSQSLPDADMASLHLLHLVLAIDAWDNSDDGNDPLSMDSTYYFDLAHQTQALVAERGDLSSLQSLILTSIYFQLSGQHSLLTQTSGAAVRLAQSLGLHRHTRRFRFCAGESEMRNRVWWCVYILDMVSSVSHGLPKLINDEDVDTELPLDCDFDDITLRELPLSLPGEATRFSIFLSYIRLVRIISNTTRRLYTTTQRRGAVEKIQTLDRELHVWEHTFSQSLRSNGPGPFDSRESQSGSQANGQGNSIEDQTFIIPYLQLMSNVAMLMIHQPALTFGPGFPQFEKSLSICAKSCMQIINTFDKNRSERRIFYLQPSSTRLIFQSALVCLYTSWYDQSTTSTRQGIDHGAAIHIPVKQTISTAIGLLELQISDWLLTHPEDANPESTSLLDALSSTVVLLKRLQAQTLQRSSSTDFQILDTSPVLIDDANAVSQQAGLESSASDDLWGPSALEGLNQLDMLEWSADYMFGSLDSYPMDFSLP